VLDRATFGELIDGTTDAFEAQTLRLIAHRTPRDIADVMPWATLSQVSESVGRLQRMGLVSHMGGRLTVSIPLLARWLRSHVDLPLEQKHETREFRRRAWAFGLFVGGVALGSYSYLYREQLVTDAPIRLNGGCEIAVQHYERAAVGSVVPLDVYVTGCDSHVSGDLALSATRGTVVAAAQPLDRQSVVVSGQSGSVGHIPIPVACPDSSTCNIEVAIHLVRTSGKHFELAVMRAGKPIGLVSIRKDPLPTVGKDLEWILKAGALLQFMVGALIAFYADGLGVLKRLSDLRRAPLS
jgi:hypothetical protein